MHAGFALRDPWQVGHSISTTSGTRPFPLQVSHLVIQLPFADLVLAAVRAINLEYIGNGVARYTLPLALR